MSTAPLRGCYACGTKVTPLQLGLREYGWISPKLPGKVGPTDIDFMLERNGDFLALEFKPSGVRPGRGQQITFNAMRDKGFDVWVVETDDATRMNPAGNCRVWWDDEKYEDMTRETLEDYIIKWYEARSAVRRGNRANGGTEGGW